MTLPWMLERIGENALASSALKVVNIGVLGGADLRSAIGNRAGVQICTPLIISRWKMTIRQDNFSTENICRVFIPKRVSKIKAKAFHFCKHLR